MTSLEPKNKLPSESAIGPIEEFSEAVTVQVVLHVSRIEMIEQVEHSQPNFHRVLFTAQGQSEFLQHLNIGRIEAPEALVITWADKVAPLVHNRVGKAGVKVKDRQHSHLPRRPKLAPDQKPIGRIEGQPSASVRLDHRLWVISEELVEVI